MTPHAVAVFIGRLQPLHRGHLSLIRQALSACSQLLVVLGSAHQAATPRNPWSWDTRADWLRAALGADAHRVHVLPLRDYYDEARWVRQVRQAVDRWCLAHEPAATITLVGHFKDNTSSYLARFPGWRLLAVPRAGEVDATPIRTDLLQGLPHDALDALQRHRDVLDPHTLQALHDWCLSDERERLHHEWMALAADRAAWAVAPYPPVFVTLDALVRCQGHVLMIQRDRAPGAGLWALPGGFLDPGESLEQSARRELQEETGLVLPQDPAQVVAHGPTVFAHPLRSQRGRVITHCFAWEWLRSDLPAVQGLDDARRARWVPEAELPALESQCHDDHFLMIDHHLHLLPDHAEAPG